MNNLNIKKNNPSPEPVNVKATTCSEINPTNQRGYGTNWSSMKPSVRSRHFPHVSAGPTRSSYFKTRRGRTKGAKRQGTEEKRPVMANDMPVEKTDDGWVTERESHRGYSENRKIRRARERRRKRRGRGRNQWGSKDSDNGGGIITSAVVGGEIETPQKIETLQKIQEGTVIGMELLECGGVTVPSPAEQAEAGKQGAQTPVSEMPAGVEMPYEFLPPERKRKRTPTVESTIINRTTLEDTGEGTPGIQSEKYQNRQSKTDRGQVKPPGAVSNSHDAKDPTPEGVIVKELRSRNIVIADGFGENVRRKRSKYAGPTRDGALCEDTASTKSSCTPPQSTMNLLESSTTSFDIVEQVPDIAMEKPVESIRRGGRKYITKTGKISSYFASSRVKQAGSLGAEEKCRKRRVLAGTSAIPWPPLTAKTFGLIQEELENNAYYVIVAAVFLNKTRGAAAVPLLRQFLIDYPSPLELSLADLTTITAFLRPLGLHHTRADRLIQMGKTWMEQPPTPGMGTTKPNYPARDTHPFNFPCPLGEDGGSPKLGVEKNCIWEIAHLPGVGAYALDSWRIFCLDRFRKGAAGVGRKEGEEEQMEDMSEEWMRVVPKDKELRAYLRWKWAKEGWVDQVEVEVRGGVDNKK